MNHFYVAHRFLRVAANHLFVRLVFADSESSAPEFLTNRYPDLLELNGAVFTGCLLNFLSRGVVKLPNALCCFVQRY